MKFILREYEVDRSILASAPSQENLGPTNPLGKPRAGRGYLGTLTMIFFDHLRSDFF